MLGDIKMSAKNTSKQDVTSSKKGFAAMPKEKKEAIAKKGWQHSHGGGRPKKG
jgi:hypothetical protein